MRLRGPSSRRRCRPVYPEKNGGSRLRAACTEPNCQKLRSLRMRGIQRATDRILEFVVQGNTAIANADGLFADCSGNPTLPDWLGRRRVLGRRRDAC